MWELASHKTVHVLSVLHTRIYVQLAFLCDTHKVHTHAGRLCVCMYVYAVALGRLWVFDCCHQHVVMTLCSSSSFIPCRLWSWSSPSAATEPAPAASPCCQRMATYSAWTGGRSWPWISSSPGRDLRRGYLAFSILLSHLSLDHLYRTYVHIGTSAVILLF